MHLAIRPYTLNDASAFHAAALESFRELQPWMPWCHSRYSLDEATEWATQKAATFAEKSEFEFLIVDDSGALLGGIGLNQLDIANRRANLGYWIRSSATRRGHATAAVKMLVEWAFRKTVLQRLEVVVAADNLASLRVAENAGAQREGVLRDRLLLHGEFHDAVLFSFVRR